MEIQVVKGDITELDVDVIVNAAKPSLLGGGGVDGAIHKKAGLELVEWIEEKIPLIGPDIRCATGHVVSSPSFGIDQCQAIYHTVGPVWKEIQDCEWYLRSCYHSCLFLASHHPIRSIAFPCISTGIYGCPKAVGAHVATRALIDFVAEIGNECLDKVVFCCFDDTSFKIYKAFINGEVLGDEDAPMVIL